MSFSAHIKVTEDGTKINQTVAEHCRNTANYSARCLSNIGLEKAAYLSGLLHDAGKCKEEFQNYIENENANRGSVNHTFTGCRMILEHFHGTVAEQFEDMTSELLAYAIGAHHGLFDCVDEAKKSGFLHRMEKANIHYEESKQNFLQQCADWNEIEGLFSKANQELSDVYNKLWSLSQQNGDKLGEEFQFYLGLLARLLLSAVIEGDRRDTAEFMNDAVYPNTVENLQEFWNKYLGHMEEKLNFFRKDTDIQIARGEISCRCRDFAEKPGNVYRLNVPTGAGKTLSSLRYALAHAANRNKRRIIFTSPLLAILEQNAQVIREFIGDDSIILEHHSNIIDTNDHADALDYRELAVENWNCPVIITTLVQLLNTLFDGKTTSIRRYQSLCNSVIVIDEVQTVPNNMLTLFNLAVNFLSNICGATVLLCSATQPCLEQAEHSLLGKPEEIVPFEEALWKPFKRTNITDAGAMTLEEIPTFAQTILTDSQSLLIVCNKKNEAEYLYQTLSKDYTACYHLSASMCTAHRRDTLKRIEQALITSKSGGSKTVCIATQVIEAGVDISFERVIRLSAGMDSIIQSAGRCNRNGESSDTVPVYIIQCQNENLSKLQDIQRSKNATIRLLEAYRQKPEQFQHDLSSDPAITYYYRSLYRSMREESGGFQDYFIKQKRNTVFSMLAGNTKYYDSECAFYEKYSINQAFKMAGALFHVFDENTVDVVVPYGEGAVLIEELCANAKKPSVSFLKDWTERAKPYTVSLYEYQNKQLSGGGLIEIAGVLLLQPGFYNEHTGFSLNNKSLDFLEV